MSIVFFLTQFFGITDIVLSYPQLKVFYFHMETMTRCMDKVSFKASITLKHGKYTTRHRHTTHCATVRLGETRKCGSGHSTSMCCSERPGNVGQVTPCLCAGQRDQEMWVRSLHVYVLLPRLCAARRDQEMWVRSLHVYVLLGETRKYWSGHSTSMC